MVDFWHDDNLDACPYCGDKDRFTKEREKTDDGNNNTWYIYLCYCYACENEWGEPYPYDDRD